MTKEVTLSSKLNKKDNKFKKNQLIFIWGGLAIPIIAWIIFYWVVNVQSFVQAFQDPVTNGLSFVNFKEVWVSMFSSAERDSLAVAFINTVKYFGINIFIQFPLQIIICYFLYKQIVGFKAFRYILYLPAILPGVALAGLFKEFIATGGPLNAMGLPIPQNGFLGSPDTATNTIIAYCIWTCPCTNMLLICGAMTRIPVEVLEAGRLDGIGPFRELVSLILPMIWPTLSTLLVLACCGFLNSSGPILLLAPDSYTLGTTTINYWIFEKVYANGTHMQGKYNLVSAAGLLLTAVALPVVLGLKKLLDLIPDVEY